jgi:hypothetical protein
VFVLALKLGTFLKTKNIEKVWVRFSTLLTKLDKKMSSKDFERNAFLRCRLPPINSWGQHLTKALPGIKK